MALSIGDAVPDADILLTGNRAATLGEFRGQGLVLYFYPKASTPGCTREGLDFAAATARFARLGCAILGASRDSLKAQENFKAKQGFPFDLIADKGEDLCKLFDVIKDKTLYGKAVRGIERSTFLIDAFGVLRREWRGVKVNGHVDEVLEAVKTLDR